MLLGLGAIIDACLLLFFSLLLLSPLAVGLNLQLGGVRLSRLRA
nr:MAG TPA: hypothetical protein [Caudoviricetes sp.]